MRIVRMEGNRCPRLTGLPGLALLLIMGLSVGLIGCSNGDGLSSQEQDASLKVSKVMTEATGSGSFTLEAKHTYIQSYPDGGGVFLVRLVPGDGFTGEVDLSMDADAALGVQMNTSVLTATSPIVEIILNPTSSVAVQTYTMLLSGVNTTDQASVALDVEVKNFATAPNDASPTKDRRRQFIKWLKKTHPELGPFENNCRVYYQTYPGMKIVEHWTFLEANYEMRVCLHVMMAPEDWAKLWLRPRGEWDAVFAAMMDTDGATPYEMPLEDYPIYYGY